MKLLTNNPTLTLIVITLLILTACMPVQASGESEHALLFELGISGSGSSVVLTDKVGNADIDLTAPQGVHVGVGSYINSVGNANVSLNLLSDSAQKGKCFLSVLSEEFANRNLTVEMWISVKESRSNTHFLSLGGYDSSAGAFVKNSGYAWLSAYYVTGTAGTRFYPGVNTQSLGPNKPDTITNGYVGDPGEDRWFHLVLTRELENSPEDGTTITKATVYLDNSTGRSKGASLETSAHSEDIAGILLGQAGANGSVYPKIRISYLKIYDGVFTPEDVSSYYENSKEQWSAAPIPKVTAASHADGSNVYTHDTVFTYKFGCDIDASTLDNGFVLKDADGNNAKINSVSLSDDKRTVTVDAYGIETGCYTLFITNSLKSSLGADAKEVSYTYNVSRLANNADFSDSNLWADWQAGEQKSAAELTQKLNWFTGLSEPTGTYGKGEFFLTSDDALTFRYDDSQELPDGYWGDDDTVDEETDSNPGADTEVGGSSGNDVSISYKKDIAHTTLSIGPPVIVKRGTLVYEMDIKQEPNASSSTRCGLYVAGTSGENFSTVEICRDMLRSYSDLRRYESAAADTDGYYNIKLVISSESASSDWSVRVYSDSDLLDEWTVERAYIKNISSLVIYNYASGGIVNDISIKNVKMEFYTEHASLNLGMPDSELKMIDLNISKADAILLGDTLTVTHTSGAHPWVELAGNGGSQYELSLFSGLPFSGSYNVSAYVLSYPDALVAIPLSASFEVENASESSVYNVTVTDDMGERAYNIRNLTSVTLGYEYTGETSGNVYAGLYDEDSLIYSESTQLKEKDSMSIIIPDSSKYLKVFFWNQKLAPLSRALVLTDLPRQEVAPLKISAEYANELGEPVNSLMSAGSVTLTADISGNTVIDGLYARLIYKDGNSVISEEIRDVILDETLSSQLIFTINGPFTESSRLIFAICSSDATYYSQIITGRDMTASDGFISVTGASLTGCASYNSDGNVVLKKNDGLLTFESVDFGSEGKNTLNLYITEVNPLGSDKLTIRIGETYDGADTYELLAVGSGSDIPEPITVQVPIRNTTGINNIYISSRGGSLAGTELAGGISGIELLSDAERAALKDASLIDAGLCDGVCTVGADSQPPVIGEIDGNTCISGINPGTVLVFTNVSISEDVSKLCVRLSSSDSLNTVTFRLDSADNAPVASFTGISDANEYIYPELSETLKSGVHDIYVSFSVRGTSDLYSFGFTN